MIKFFVVMVLAVSACASTAPKFRTSLDPSEETIVYVEYYDRGKDDAFVAASAWIAKNFNSAGDVIQMSDKKSGTIVVKALWPVPWTQKGGSGTSGPVVYNVSYTMTFQSKNNKGKIEFHTGHLINQQSRQENLYLDSENMPKLFAYYDDIKDNLIKAITAKPDEF